jgi:hypothetical protein
MTLHRVLATLLVGSLAAAAPANDTPSHDAPAHAEPAHAGAAAPGHPAAAPPIAGFAAALAERPLIPGPAAWVRIPTDEAWDRIAAAGVGDRQSVRWDYAGSLIAAGRGPDAMGVLEVMRSDDPDLSLVPGWRRANGVAAATAGHYDDALAMLADPMLVGDAESCLWRMRALAGTARWRPALEQLACALPALNARHGRDRRPFILAAGEAAVALHRDQAAITWLAALPDGDAAANLLRGKAMLGVGQGQQGRLRFERVALSGDPAERADAEISTIEAGLDAHDLPDKDAAKRLGQLMLTWRGDEVEQRTLRTALALALRMHDTPAALQAGATLFRYGGAGADAGAIATQLRALLAAALSPESKLPLPQAAGLFWDYRDLAPAGAVGDRLADGLVDRLQAAGLYTRAADLLDHRMNAGPRDIEQGPLSVRVATLRILAGHPDDAIRMLRSTDDIDYPAAMFADRRRVEAAALDIMGRRAEALAALQDVPDAAGIAAEIHWQARDWAHLAEVGEPALPPPGKLSDVGQAVVLRHAIALAMLQREAALARLRDRYAASFAKLPTAAAFGLLTAKPGTIDPARMANAMASLPSASPAGAIGDLIEQGREARAQPAG